MIYFRFAVILLTAFPAYLALTLGLVGTMDLDILGLMFLLCAYLWIEYGINTFKMLKK